MQHCFTHKYDCATVCLVVQGGVGQRLLPKPVCQRTLLEAGGTHNSRTPVSHGGYVGQDCPIGNAVWQAVGHACGAPEDTPPQPQLPLIVKV